MKNFIVYNSDGKILRHGECADSDISLQASTGESILEAKFEPNKKIVDGALVDDTPTQAALNTEALNLLRKERTHLLKITAWTQINDSPLSTDVKKEWEDYRKELRDLPAAQPANLSSIDDVVWPTQPS